VLSIQPAEDERQMQAQARITLLWKARGSGSWVEVSVLLSPGFAEQHRPRSVQESACL
jgi:hypothetical protein